MRALLTLVILWTIHFTASGQGYTLPAEIPFTQVKVAGNIHLELVASDTQYLQFEGEAPPEKLEVEWEDNRLTLKNPLELKQTPAITLKIFYTTLSGLEISRGGVVQSMDTLITKSLTLKVETGGKAEFTIDTDSVSARLNQGADIILRGRSRSQSVNAYTLGNYLAYELETENTWVKAASGAQVKVSSNGYLNANATSKAFIGYQGSPEKKEFKSSVGGEITQQNP